MVLVCLPSDALLQQLPSYLGFSYTGRGVSLHGCPSKVQLLLLILDEGYLVQGNYAMISPKLILCSGNSQCHYIGNGGNGAFGSFRSCNEGGTLKVGLELLYEETRELTFCSPVCHMRSQWDDSCLQARRRALTRYQFYQHLDLVFPNL